MSYLNLIRIIFIAIFLALSGQAYAAIFEADDISKHFPKNFDIFERGKLSRVNKINGFKSVRTIYLSFTPGARISSSVIVTPAKLGLEKSFTRLEAGFNEKYQQIQKLGQRKRNQVINGQVSLEIEAAFQVVDHIFGREQNTYLYVIMRQIDDEIIQINARTPLDEWKTMPAKIRGLIDRVATVKG